LIKELKESVKRTGQFLKSDDRTGHIEEDTLFHGAIAKATENQELCRVLENIQNQIWLFRCQTYDLSSSTAPRAHTAILKAFEEGDRVQAETAMREHISHVRSRLVEFIGKKQLG
jgi:DNA-binding GntR family transcriptional regulator